MSDTNSFPWDDSDTPIDEALLDDMSAAELRRFGHEIADWIADFRAGIEERPVLARTQPGDLLGTLPAAPPVDGESMDAILRDFRESIVPASTHWNHPGFHAYFANSASGPGILAEALTAALNVNAMLWRTGPAATELELRSCDWLRQMVGLPGSFEGHIEDTASVSTLIALAAARHRATGGDVREKGLSGRAPMRVYCSEEAHSSVEKALIVLGLGQEGCRRIAVDEEFRMRPELLMQAIQEDRAAGFTPMAVVATTGTTSTTSIDPVEAIAAICENEKLWLHVDAAYGGAMAIVPRHRHVLAGADRAHSVVINPHKWLLVPMDCSVLFLRDAAAVREAFSLVPAYLMTPEDDRARNLMDYGPALGRRFRALKLWFVLRWFGWKRLAAIVDHHVELAREFAEGIEAHAEWECVAPAPMSTVLFRHLIDGDEATRRAHNEKILERVNREGRSFLSHTEVRRGSETVYALRFAVGNVGTQRSHVEGAWASLQEAARAV